VSRDRGRKHAGRTAEECHGRLHAIDPDVHEGTFREAWIEDVEPLAWRSRAMRDVTLENRKVRKTNGAQPGKGLANAVDEGTWRLRMASMATTP